MVKTSSCTYKLICSANRPWGFISSLYGKLGKGKETIAQFVILFALRVITELEEAIDAEGDFREVPVLPREDIRLDID